MDQYDKGHMDGYRKGLQTAIQIAEEESDAVDAVSRLNDRVGTVNDLDHDGGGS